MRSKLFLISIALTLLMVCSGCYDAARAIQTSNARRRAALQPPAPCSTPVSPIRYDSGIVLSVSVNYTYTPKDASQARPWHQEDVVSYLNELGKGDGNAFSQQNGQPVNFYMVYTINNDGQDHFTGSLAFSGWGQGYISTFSTQNAYSDTGEMTRNLTAQAYTFIHGGWHDLRPNCPQN